MIIVNKVIFHGRVQGVGFRRTAEQLALAAGLTGWVRNLEDGSVEMLLEGDEDVQDAVLDDLHKRFEITWSHAVPQEAGPSFETFRQIR